MNIGRRPIAAFGNSDGDLQMLQGPMPVRDLALGCLRPSEGTTTPIPPYHLSRESYVRSLSRTPARHTHKR